MTPAEGVARHRILIAGCGDVGSALGVELATQGHEVFGLRRNVRALPDSLHPVAADLGRPESLADLPPNLDAVVYAAAADRTDETAYRSAYVDGVDHLVAALVAQEQQPRCLLFTSSTGVYGQSSGEWVDETSATEPRRFTGKLVLEGERRVASCPWPSTSVRFGGIYGPGRGRLLARVRQGGLTVDRRHPAYTNRIHRDDCAGALAHLLNLSFGGGDLAGAPLPQAVVGVDDAPAPRHEVYDWLADRLGVPRPAEADGAAGAGLHGGSKRCRNTLLRSLGYDFRYPTYREGYAELLGDRQPLSP